MLNNIYLNTKIIKKFSQQTQKLFFQTFLNIFDDIRTETQQVFKENSYQGNEHNNEYNIKLFHQIKKVFNLCIFTRFLYSINKESRNMFCCTLHSPKNATQILQPSLKERIQYLNSVIISIINADDISNTEMFFLFNFLCLNLAPCLQIFCINILISRIKRIEFYSDEDKKKFLEQSQKNNLQKIIIHLIKDGIWDVKLKALDLIIECTNKIDIFFKQEDFWLLQRAFFLNAKYTNIIDIYSRRRGNSVSNISHINLDNNKVVSKRSNSMDKKLKKINYEVILPNFKNKELDNQNQVEKFKELKFSKYFCDYFQNQSQKRKEIKIDIPKNIFQPKTKLLIINDSIITLYQKLFLWISKLPKSSKSPDTISLITHKVLSIIIYLINSSFSFKLLEMFLNDLTNHFQELMDISYIAYSNKLFLFLLETTAHFFSLKNNKYNRKFCLYLKANPPISVNFSSVLKKLFNILHKILYLNIKFNNNIKIICELLTWLTYQQIISNEYQSLYTFIEEIFYEVNKLYFTLEKNQLILSSKTLLSHNNLAKFLNVVFEYITVQQNNLMVLTNPNGYIDVQNHVSPFTIPCFLLSWVDLNDKLSKIDKELYFTQKINKYLLFTSIYYKFQKVWNIYGYLSEKEKHNFNNINKKIKLYNQAIEEFVYNSQKSSFNPFLEEIKFLFLPNNEKPKKYISFPLITLFFNFLIISLLANSEKKELKFWIQELENMLLYLIIVSLNCHNQLKPEQQTTFLSIIAFGMNFLIQQFHSSKIYKELYNECIYMFFYVINKILSNKNFVGLFKTTALYLLFFEFIVDKNKNNLLVHPKTFGIKIKNNEDIKQFYNEKSLLFWNKYLSENDDIKKRMINFFGKTEYVATVSRRYFEITKIIPQYETTINWKKIKLIRTLQLKVNDIYDMKNSKTFCKAIDVVTSSCGKIVLEEFTKQKVIRHKTILSFKQRFKNIIKSLFKFRGGWADKQSFYSDSCLPNKIVNHYSLDMTMPLLTPVVDKSYPLLNKIDNDSSYLFNCDMDLFLKQTKKKYKELSNINNIANTVDNKIYKKLYPKKYSKNLVNNNSMLSKNDLSKSYNDINCSDLYFFKNNIKNENIYNGMETVKFMVCLVKPTIHIKGCLELVNNVLCFKSGMYLNNHLSDEEKFYKLSLKCRGSCHKDTKNNSNNSKQIIICFKIIKYIFIRNFYFEKKAIEIFTSENKGYYFHFINQKSLVQFLNIIHKSFQSFKPQELNENLEPNIIGYYNLALITDDDNTNEFNYISFQTLHSKWREKHSISTLHFISWLNILVGRSYKDITQYPIFPWPIINYTSKEINYNSQLDIRNFSLSMEVIDVDTKSKNRKNYVVHTHKMQVIGKNENSSYKNKNQTKLASLIFPNSSLAEKLKSFPFDKYKKLKKINNYLYDNLSTYSTCKHILSYLIRVYPFKSVYGISKYTKYQFNSINDSFYNSASSRNDFNELTPEFFYMSEIFVSTSPSQLQNVQLPIWSNNEPYEVISLFRQVIEKDPNQNIYKWIRMMFNEMNSNKVELNHFYCSRKQVQGKISTDNTIEILKPAYWFLVNKGIIPSPKITELIDNKNLSNFEQKSIKQNDLIRTSDIPYKIKENQKTIFPIYAQQQKVYPNSFKIKMLLNDLSIYTFKVKEKEKTYTIKEEKLCNKHLSDKINCDLHKKLLYNNVFVIYQKGFIIIGGYSDGSIKYFNEKENKDHVETIQLESNTSPVTSIECVSKSNAILFGTQQGTMMVFEILHKRDKFNLNLIDIKNDHSDEIIVITFNENLQIFATASYDEYIFVYTFPNIKCIRSFYFSNFYANKIIISTNPLPMFVFYCEEINGFKLFTINGSKIEVEEDYILRAKTVTSFAKFTDCQYCDHLIIGTEDGYVIIMEFPKLKIETIVKVFKEKIKFSIPVLNGLGVLCYAERNKIFKLVHKDVNPEHTEH